MSLDPARTPVVVATGQSVDRAGELGPLDLAEEACRAALAEAPGLGSRIERLSLVNVLAGRAGPAPASELALRLGLSPKLAETTVIGGNMPQSLVTRAAAAIAAGELTAAIVAGGEAVRSTRLRPQARPGGAPGRSRPEGEEPDPLFGTERQDLSDEERAAGLLIPVFVYPLFESVLAARAGRDNAAQRRYIARFLSAFSEVASANFYAWFREPLSPAQIAEPSPGNRLVAEPYTKLMTAFLGSAHGSCLVLTSLQVASELGLGDNCVFVWAGADSEDAWYPIEREDLGSSPALVAAGNSVLRSSGVGIDDVALFDLYSCFPSAVQIAADSLGLSLEDDRRLTVTGGLPYFGGPGSNYVGHSVATMVELLRSRQGERALGLVTGVGWYLTKHAVGLYSNEPPAGRASFEEIGRPSSARSVGLRAGSSIEQTTRASVIANTVVYDRAGTPVSAPVIAALSDGTRVAAVAAAAELTSVAELASVRPLAGREIELSGGAPPAYRLS